MPPTVVILGRPNVGKSTLFNRLVGRRIAIVDDTPGVTRDRKEAAARIGGRDVLLVDTAGLEEAAPETLPGRMRASSRGGAAAGGPRALRGRCAGRHDAGGPRLRAVAAAAGVPVILVANKTEGRLGG